MRKVVPTHFKSSGRAGASSNASVWAGERAEAAAVVRNDALDMMGALAQLGGCQLLAMLAVLLQMGLR